MTFYIHHARNSFKLFTLKQVIIGTYHLLTTSLLTVPGRTVNEIIKSY